MIIAYGYYQRQIDRERERKTILILFFNQKIAKQKYKKRRKMSNTILFRLIQQQEILGNTLVSGLVLTARRFLFKQIIALKFVFRKANQKQKTRFLFSE